MVFASHVFLFWFLPLLLLAYSLAPRAGRSALLVVASYAFYGWWRIDFLIPLIVSTLLDYWCGGKIWAAGEELRARAGDEAMAVRRAALVRRRRLFLWLSMVVNLGLLAYFKYADFGIEELRALLASFGADPGWHALGVVLPVGISFYTFQSMSYTLDLYRGQARPVDRFQDFACYVALFPQLVCGPIVRYQHLAGQLRERAHTWAKFSRGVMLFQLGLAKKLLIADPAGGVADAAFGVTDPSVAEAWTGTLAYTLQIYFDFSGYSDMAIGLGAMLGFVFPINFNSPYKSESVTDFWRRWHVSLSSWMRDYLYISIGGNRKGAGRTYVNLITVFVLCGLWHGAAWTFVAWGAYHGLWLIIERLAGKRSIAAAAPRPVARLLTFLIAMGGWVFFRATSMDQAFDFLGAMAGFAELGWQFEHFTVGRWPAFTLGLGLVIAFFAPNTQQLVAKERPWLGWAAAAVFLLAVTQMFFASYVPFLYFQF